MKTLYASGFNTITNMWVQLMTFPQFRQLWGSLQLKVHGSVMYFQESWDCNKWVKQKEKFNFTGSHSESENR